MAAQDAERLLVDMSVEVASIRWDALHRADEPLLPCALAIRHDVPHSGLLVTMTTWDPPRRACMDQFISGIRPGEEAQVQQAKVVQRVQMRLERLAELGQAAHVVLPPNLHEVKGPLLHGFSRREF